MGVLSAISTDELLEMVAKEGNVNRAAKKLGVHPNGIYARIKNHESKKILPIGVPLANAIEQEHFNRYKLEIDFTDDSDLYHIVLEVANKQRRSMEEQIKYILEFYLINGGGGIFNGKEKM